MTEPQQPEPTHDHGPNAVLVVLASLAIFVVGCVVVIAFAIR